MTTLLFMLIRPVAYFLGVFSAAANNHYRWWIIGFIVGTWWSRGALTMGMQMKQAEPRPEWEVPALIIIHLSVLSGLVGFSIANLMLR
ncbi:MAG: hypothetical protein H0X02_11910 [Nitrosomonas sp.]|nr:hypothetical protein [Nitrosomonas sp.]